MRFSDRIGATRPRDVFQVDSIDEPLANGLWEVIISRVLLIAPYDVFDDNYDVIYRSLYYRIYTQFLKIPSDSMPSTDERCRNEIKRWFFTSEWYEKYNFVEFINDVASDISELFNEILDREHSAYRFVSGVLVPITSDSEIGEIERAVNSGNSSVSEHLNAALSLLSDKRTPDFRNSIKESISAVEAAARQVSGNQKATLGDALNQLDKAHPLHSALKEGFKKIYGWSSDSEGIRHAMMEVSNLTQADARFMLVACSAFANYLIDRTK